MQNGKIHTKRLEINVVHHCNLSCKGCGHLSPIIPEFFLSPDGLFHDLSILSRSCRPEIVSLVGGEPLLHPDLSEIIKVVRRSGITNKIRVVTNGLLLHRMSEQFWKSVDEIHVSLYPNHPKKLRDLAVYKRYAKRNSVGLKLRYQDYFNEYFLETANTDEPLVRRIYLTCSAPREACCHTLYEGHYYKCPRAVFIPMIHKNRADLAAAKDGLDIRGSKNLGEDLVEYFSTKTPLRACRYCLGSIGKRFTPQQVSRQAQTQSISQDKLIDWNRLGKLEQKKGLPLPNWLQEAQIKISSLISKLPPSVLLSSALRRSINVLREMKRNHLK
jgi:organic radical activating enzyme